jgi:RimJ/RimL family protein N-acetyltransferase
LPRVVSLIHPENAASRRVAEKMRMQFERKTVFKGFPCWFSRLAANGG